MTNQERKKWLLFQGKINAVICLVKKSGDYSSLPSLSCDPTPHVYRFPVMCSPTCDPATYLFDFSNGWVFCGHNFWPEKLDIATCRVDDPVYSLNL